MGWTILRNGLYAESSVTTQVRQALRARIVLATAGGLENGTVARELKISVKAAARELQEAQTATCTVHRGSAWKPASCAGVAPLSVISVHGRSRSAHQWDSSRPSLPESAST
jgi:hypothetical protein